MNKITIYLMAVAVIFLTACTEEFDKDSAKYKVDTKVTSVELNNTTLTIVRNATATLRATVKPDRATNPAIKWSSSNNDVASVSETGVVTAKENGTATITVTTEDGGKTATCTVTVSESVATQVRINKTSTTLNVGQAEALTATVTPANTSDKAVTWSTSDETIATVTEQGGVVNAIAPGEATITVTTVSGGQTHTCTVTVLRPVSGVKISESLPFLLVGEEIILTATVEPADASNKGVTWRVAGSGIVMITDTDAKDRVTVQRTGTGTGTVTVVTDDGAKTADAKIIDGWANLTGAVSKTWTWDFDAPPSTDNGQFGPWGWGSQNNSGPDWWNPGGYTSNPGGPGSNDQDPKSQEEWYLTGEYTGATMTFSKTGLTFEKNKTVGAKEEGTFKLDLSKTRTSGWYNYVGELSIVGGPTVLNGKSANDQVFLADEPAAPIVPKEFVVLKLTETQLILGFPEDGKDNNGNWRLGQWSGSTYWYFKPAE